jgi:preprotein translocase subunit SecF
VLFVGLAAGTYSSIFLATPIVADLKEREPEVIALRKRVQARRSSAVRGGARPAAGPVASARRTSRSRSGVALAELPESVEGDVVIESPSTVGPEPRSGATAAPRPGARPQRPGRPAGKRRR